MPENPLFESCGSDRRSVKAAYFQPLYDAPMPIFIAREDGRFLLVNRAVQDATGFAAEEIPTIDAWVRHLEIYPGGEAATRFAALVQSQPAHNPLQAKVRTKNGEMLIWEFFNTPIGKAADGQQMVLIFASDAQPQFDHERQMEAATARLEQEVSRRTKDLNATIIALENEIAERKLISDALHRSRERLKLMSRRTLDVLEADRQTVSKELHDSIGASLAAIKFSLEIKEMKRKRNNGRLDESLDHEISYLMAAIKESKRISANLRPTTLDDLGLMATINWYLRQFRRLYGNIRVRYTKEITEAEVPEPMKIIIYRIVQEGLSNAAKHSEARSVRLHIGFSGDNRALVMTIEDDGRGFNVDEIVSRKDPLSGYGLIAMRERCEILGGSLNIESSLGTGTKINALLPINP